MRNDYGNLRRRTSDASWQWLLMGTLLGVGFALVACVGGYAVGVISFPPLEEDTASPRAQIEPNQTEVALQALAAQQTLEAAQQVLTDSPEATAESTDVAELDGAIPVTPLPTPLPTTQDNTPVQDSAPAQDDAPAMTEPQNPETVLNPTATVDQVEVQTEVLTQGTPVVGTPPVDESAQTMAMGLPQGPQIPPALDAIKTEMVTVTGGTFMMGTTLEEGKQAMDECALYGKSCPDPNWIADSIPPHQTTVDSFEMEVYEVSVDQYVTFLNWMGPNEHKTGCNGQPCLLTTSEESNSLVEFDGETYQVRNPGFYTGHPIAYVTWWGAVEYCRTLDRRLPTEAEWERAARGSQNYIYPWGFSYDTARAMSSIEENAGTVPVSSYPTGGSPYGVFNMAGNVSEWVFDWYQSDYYTIMANNPEPNPRGPATGTEKVIRGGSWDTIPLFLRAVHRMSQQPDQPIASIGFRCVADAAAAVPVAPSASTGTTGTTTDASSLGGAPTMAPPPTQAPLPTATPAGPTPTLAPG